MAKPGQSRKSGARPDPVRRPRGRPSAKAAAEIDRQILDVALELFLRHGFGQTSMAMIIRTAGISKTTLYSRYPSKADLFRAIVWRTVAETRNLALEPERAMDLDLVEGLNVFGRAAIAISWKGNWPSYERLVHAEGLRFPELGLALSDRVSNGIVTVTRFLRDCAARDGEDIPDPENIARTYIMALRGYYSDSLLSSTQPPEEDTAQFVEGLVRSLFPERVARAKGKPAS